MGRAERIRLQEIGNELPDALLGQLLDFAEYLKIKADKASINLDEETQVWLSSDLSRMSEIEPYDWGDIDPLTYGKPIKWDEEKQAFIVIGREDGNV